MLHAHSIFFRISSVIVKGGCKVALYEHSQWQGDKKTIRGGQGYINSISPRLGAFNDKTSSFKCVGCVSQDPPSFILGLYYK